MLHNNESKDKRVSVFVDGNNLFYGIYDIGWLDLLWTDLHALGGEIASRFVNKLRIVSVKHFTARPHEVPSSKLKLPLWVEHTGANRVHGSVESIPGRFVPRGRGRLFEEKETDANLSAHLCLDAAFDDFDIAVVITADTDFIGTIRYLKRRVPRIKVVLGLPPKPPGAHQSQRLIKQADGFVSINRRMLLRCQLPDEVIDPESGRVYRKPTLQQWQRNPAC